jgi:hypothetical protein
MAHSFAEIGKARCLLGYEPSVEFGEGLERTIVSVRASFRMSRCYCRCCQ